MLIKITHYVIRDAAVRHNSRIGQLLSYLDKENKTQMDGYKAKA